MVTDQKQPRILQQALNGERIVANDPQLALISEIVSLNDKLLAEFNSANDRTTAKCLFHQLSRHHFKLILVVIFLLVKMFL